MTNEQKLVSLNARLAALKARGDKNVKSTGVLRKINRKIRNLSSN